MRRTGANCRGGILTGGPIGSPNFLLSRNVRRGTKVGILLMNCLEWLPIYFGILKAGHRRSAQLPVCVR